MEDSSYSNDTKSDYSGALVTRVKSLTNGINGQLLCSGIELSDSDLFDENVIIDLSRIGSTETRSFYMGILVMKLQEYRMSRRGGTDEKLNHLTILEEAHNLLRRTSAAQSQESSNLQGKSVEMITNSIAEMRTYGEGFMIVDQAPGLLDEAVIRNTNTKIILRLPDNEDREIVGKAVALSDEQIKEVAKLPKGVAVIYQNNWVEAVLCHFGKFENKNTFLHKNVKENTILPYEMFCQYVFEKNTFRDLRRDRVEHLLLWIDNAPYSLNTKRLMKKAVERGNLSAEEKRIISYNVFGGKMVASLLAGAVTEKEGIKRAEQYITMNTSLTDERIVKFVREMIIQVIINQDSSSELSKRYLEYRGRIL